MKEYNKISLMIISALAFAFALSDTAMAGMDFAYHCYDENCREGTKIDYSVWLMNTANVTLEFDKLILRSDEHKVIVDFDVSPAITLKSGESHFYNFTREVKILPADSYTLTVRPCLEVKYEKEPGVKAVYSFCSLSVYNIPVLPNSRINCNSSAQCSGNEECFFFRCKELKCVQGQTAENHLCVPEKCGPFESAVNNSCQKDPRKVGGTIIVIAIVVAVLLYLLLNKGNGKQEKHNKIHKSNSQKKKKK